MNYNLLNNFLFLLLFLLLSLHVHAANVSIINVNRASGLPSDLVTTVSADEENIWVGTANGGVAKVSPTGRVIRVYKVEDGLPSNRILSIASYGGKIFAGTDSGLGVFDGSAWESLESVKKFSLKNLYLRTEPEGKRLWVGSVNPAGGLLRYDGKKWEFLGGQGRGPLNHIRSFAFQDGTTWLGSSTSGVYRHTGTEIQYFKDKAGFPSTNVVSLEVFDGAAWAGTPRGGVRYENGRWIPLTRATGFPLSSVFSMATSPGALYLGGREGLFRYRSGRYDPLPLEEAPAVAAGVDALACAEGTVYAGTSKGLLIIRGW
jgi:ligand-binding sensor domain-containing protein